MLYEMGLVFGTFFYLGGGAVIAAYVAEKDKWGASGESPLVLTRWAVAIAVFWPVLVVFARKRTFTERREAQGKF